MFLRVTNLNGVALNHLDDQYECRKTNDDIYIVYEKLTIIMEHKVDI